MLWLSHATGGGGGDGGMVVAFVYGSRGVRMVKVLKERFWTEHDSAVDVDGVLGWPTRIDGRWVSGVLEV